MDAGENAPTSVVVLGMIEIDDPLPFHVGLTGKEEHLHRRRILHRCGSREQRDHGDEHDSEEHRVHVVFLVQEVVRLQEDAIDNRHHHLWMRGNQESHPETSLKTPPST